MYYNNVLIIDAKSFIKKLIGLSFKKNINYGMRFKTHAIHTFFMLSPIDIIITDKNNIILEKINNFKRGKILIRKNAFYIYEMPIGFNKNIKKGKELKID